MSNFRIEEEEHVHECGTCGDSYASSFRIYKDGELWIELEGYAHCYDDVSYNDSDVFLSIMAKLGHTVESGNLYSRFDKYDQEGQPIKEDK